MNQSKVAQRKQWRYSLAVVNTLQYTAKIRALLLPKASDRHAAAAARMIRFTLAKVGHPACLSTNAARANFIQCNSIDNSKERAVDFRSNGLV